MRYIDTNVFDLDTRECDFSTSNYINELNIRFEPNRFCLSLFSEACTSQTSRVASTLCWQGYFFTIQSMMHDSRARDMVHALINIEHRIAHAFVKPLAYAQASVSCTPLLYITNIYE